jgi:hypothetical protein
MSPKKDHSHSVETPSSESNSVEVSVVDVSGDILGDEVGLVGEQVSEVAKEKASEQGKGSRAQCSKNGGDSKKKPSALDERMMLRERLLKQAPKALIMRREVESVLLTKKSRLESSINKLSRSIEYDLLSEAVAELRKVVLQIHLAAHASFEVLQEIWLRVVRKFA